MTEATPDMAAGAAGPLPPGGDLRRALVLSAAMVGAAGLAAWMMPSQFLADQAEPASPTDPARRSGRDKLAAIVPREFAQWQVDRSIIPVPPSPDLQRVLDATYDETLARTYRNAQGQRVMLSMAYGRNQHKGMNTHRPEICYPAQGFKLLSPGAPGHLGPRARSLPVTRLVAGLGPRIEPITYWLLVGEHITPFGYAQRWLAIQYGLRGLIPDGVLVRVSSIDADSARAYAVHEHFITELLAALPPQHLSRLIGPARPIS